MIDKGIPLKVAVNGLTRSGTNLMSSLLAAQEGVFCGDLGIAELQYIIEFTGANNRVITHKDLIKVNKKIDEFKNKTTLSALNVLMPNATSHKTGYRKMVDAYFGVRFGDFLRYYNEFYTVNTIDEYGDIYTKFALEHELDVFATRVTAATSYANCFIERGEDYYWIEVVRNPFARFYSSKRAHSLLAEDSFKQSRWQIEMIEQVNNPRIIVVEYEDLVCNTKEVMSNIMDKFNKNEKQVFCIPISPDSDIFYGNTSDNEAIFQQDNTRDPVYTSSLDSYINKLSRYEYCVASHYGFETKRRNNLWLLPYLIKPYLVLVDVIEGVLIFLSITAKYTSIFSGCMRYLFRGGYTIGGVSRRVYSNQKKKYLKWKY